MKKIISLFIGMLFLMPVFLTGCNANLVFPSSTFEFFQGYTWEELVGFVFWILFGLLPGFNIFQFVKVKLGWEGGKAQALVMGLSVAITALCMFVAGVFNIDEFTFTLDELIKWGSFVYVGSQIAYTRFKNSQSV